MPDIISRIRVEAQGADQAAREIRKLKEAYDQVSASARGLSPASIGAGDPFSKATAPNAGVMAGGQSNADVMARETRNKNYQDQAVYRQAANQSFNASLRGAPGQVGSAFSVAEAAGSGRGGAAVGGIASMLGGVLGGPAGIAALTLGAAAMGIQKFSESSYGRLENVFGSGMSQRLGARYTETQNYMTELGRTGVPIGMVQAIMSGASRSGARFNEASASKFGLFADIAAGSGADAGLLGQLIGSTQRAGITTKYGTFAAGAGSFGRENLNTFLTELNRTIEGAMTRGISLSQEEANRQGNVISGYAGIGGLTPTGAAALNQMAAGRAQSTALLTRPEDIIAFQAMRQSGESLTDTLRRMEETPTQTNEAVVQYLRRATGGDEDLLRLRTRQYLGGSATMGQVEAFLNVAGSKTSAIAGGGLPKIGVRGKTTDADGNLIDSDPARETVAARQIEALKGVQDASLELTTMFGEFASWLKGAPINTNATNVTFGGVRKDLIDSARSDLSATIAEVNTLTAQDVTNIEAVINSANLTVKDMKTLDSLLGTPTFATNISSIAAIKNNPVLQDQINKFSNAIPGKMQGWEDLKASGFNPLGGGVGSFRDLFEQMFSAVRYASNKEATEGLRGSKKRQASQDLTEAFKPIFDMFYGNDAFLDRQIRTTEELSQAITDLVNVLGDAGVVFTDGGLSVSKD